MAKESKAEKSEKPAKGDKPPREPKPAKAGKAAGEEKAAKAPRTKAPKGDEGPVVPRTKPRLLAYYETTVLGELAKKLGRSNKLSLPRLDKIVVNMGVGTAVAEKKHLEEAVESLGIITGQKPVITKARKAVSGFRLREEVPIGCVVTLRGWRMFEFFDRLVSVALPRVRDFRGLNPNGFDGHGNYNMGLSEQLVFPELNPDKFLRPQGMNITMVIDNATNDEARELLLFLGMPFRDVARPQVGVA